MEGVADARLGVYREPGKQDVPPGAVEQVDEDGGCEPAGVDGAVRAAPDEVDPAPVVPADRGGAEQGAGEQW